MDFLLSVTVMATSLLFSLDGWILSNLEWYSGLPSHCEDFLPGDCVRIVSYGIGICWDGTWWMQLGDLAFKF